MWSSLPEVTWEVLCMWTITDHWVTSPKSLTKTFNSLYLKLTSLYLKYHFCQNWTSSFSLLSKFCGWVYHQPAHQESKIPPTVTKSHPSLFPNILYIHSFLFISIVIFLVQGFNHPFNKHILNSYDILSTICQVLCEEHVGIERGEFTIREGEILS